ncbi:Erythronolide synthase, modules 1 and 2 [Coniochaeta hoffmannii]|uniref:Erythronolide synthase, modules 1 and 2 n=1 Tax=Coniochaeta hoffmannii TaxID=91930 RepID=A0AA38S3D2_9PEZI|nr:Erythronolide synthase, modules 1 and 2 [Coniochaeta hoffmannii]
MGSISKEYHHNRIGSPAKEHNFNDVNGSSRLRLCLPELLDATIKKYSEKVAVICGDAALTFGELDAFSDGFARALLRRGICHGDLVGVALERCVELVPVLLAILKTGAAYVPIEPALPAERIKQMMDNACPKLVITGRDKVDALATAEHVRCMSIDEVLGTSSDIDLSGQSRGDDVTLSSNILTENLAYVMYTSGSTGQPKGCEITHGALTNLLLSMQEEPGCGDGDRLLAITTVSFDMAVVDWFLPLFTGATIVMAQRHELTDMTGLVGLMERHQITMMQGTPTIWQMLLDSGWRGQPRLKRIVSAGEALPRALADRLLDCGEAVWNLYGVTEASVYSTVWRVCRGQGVVIGSPIANTHLYVLDDDLSPVPVGCNGELCIGGLGVGRGYRNNAELSSARFPGNPFHPGLMYRTGDVARLAASGTVRHMGRMDGQVKIRGHRIELGDIEAAATAHEDIAAAVVVGRDDQLVAYCVREIRHLGHSASVIEGAVRPGLDQLLRSWLSKRLPAYMMPAFFVELQALPVLVSGKIDRKALPDPVAAPQPKVAGMLPATELERQILAVWSSVLGHDRVKLHDNFFEIGGNSLRVVYLQKELERLLGRPVPTAKLFEHYTIKTLAAYLSASPDSAHPGSEPTRHFHVSDRDIAVISTACRLPGGIATPEDFWELLESGGDAITDVPDGRWNRNADSNAEGQSYCRRGGFIPSIHSSDISFFGISPKEARRLDPSQYMLLETCWEGFERAGYTKEQLGGSQTGVFIGTSNIPAHSSLNPGAIRDLSELDGYTVTGSSAGTSSGRISYHLGLQGPAMTIDTACSSSLVATHLACTSLREGECDMAVAGGIHLMLNPGLHAEFSRLQGMSPDGRCRSFSDDTQGTGWAEGAGVVVLKRLSDARRDGDRIHAVIRGTAVNHDGRSAGLTVPSGPAQQRLVRTALTAARLQPNDIDYVEAHGTATKLGDPIEATALGEVFGPSRVNGEPLLIGTAKSNISHTQAASGLVGLLKVMLSLEHGILPKSLHITKPTGAVDWQRSNMALVLDNTQWASQEGRLRRAGVSAFGIGGTNAHIIVEEPPKPSTTPDNLRTAAQLPRALPFLLSGDTDAALCMQAEKLHRHLSSPDNLDSMGDVAYSLATTRTQFRRRLVMTARDKAELLEELDSAARGDSLALLSSGEAPDTTGLAMLFTGQGDQWPGMGKDLCEIYPIFAKTMRELAAWFDSELEAPLLDVMWAEPGTAAAALLQCTEFAQPALFALEVALYRLWESWGVTPAFVLGHSLGELVAAHVAGVMDSPDACRLVAARGRLMQALSCDNHSMVSVEASAAEVAQGVEELGHGGEVDVAAYNTPFQTVISGNGDCIKILARHFAAQGRKAKTLVVGHAFHSRHMDGMLEDFRAVAETVRFRPAKLPVISTLDGRLVETNRLGNAQYWVEQAREPVRFSDGIRALVSHGANTFLEVGPDQVLCGMGAACLEGTDESGLALWLPSLRRRKDSASILQHSAALLHMRHVPIDWRAYFRPFACERIQLPTYAFQREFHVHHETKSVDSSSTNGTSLMNDAGSLNGHRSSTDNTIQRGSQDGRGGNQFAVSWQAVEKVDIHPRGSWGLLVPAGVSKWTTSVAAALSQAGVQLVQVEHFPPAEKLDGIISLWHATADIISQARGVVSEALEQLQAAAQTQCTTPLVWITHHEIGTGDKLDDHSMRPGPGSLLWGLMRTARSEHPELDLRLVDLDRQATGASIVSAVMLGGETECASTLAKHGLVRPGGAVLITGGLGDLGARVARWLASDHGVHDLVLISRRGMDSPAADDLVAGLCRLGARVTVITGDVADAECIRSIMAIFKEDRPLRGIVHAAGVVDSGVLSSMTPQRCETTIAPKMYGAWNLHQATQHVDMDLFMMFSSISGVMGMPGLANYAASNSFLDALAHFRRAQGLPATSVAYGTWAGDGGMASKLASATLSHLAQYGLDPLPPDEGLDLFRQAVMRNHLATLTGLKLSVNIVFLHPTLRTLSRFLLSELQQQDTLSNDSVDNAEKRLSRTLQEYGLWEPQFASLIKPLVGDTAQHMLGLSHKAFDDLASNVDAVCHSGALVDWLRPLDDYVGPNIVSAHEILRLASRGRPKAIHLVSTISTLPKHMGLDLTEADFEYGYGTSKYVAEQLVAAARWRGAGASVYRLPYVTASTATGHFRRDRGDFLHNFLAGSLEMGAFPSVRADMSAVLPVDYLAGTIVAMMTRDVHRRLGGDFDFLSTRAPTCDEFFRLMSDGRPCEILDFGMWKQRAMEHAATHPASALGRIAAVLDCYTDETVTSMFEGLPVGKNVLGGDDCPAPALNDDFVKVYLDRIGSQCGNWGVTY